jgi:hypothetical protein
MEGTISRPRKWTGRRPWARSGRGRASGGSVHENCGGRRRRARRAGPAKLTNNWREQSLRVWVWDLVGGPNEPARPGHSERREPTNSCGQQRLRGGGFGCGGAVGRRGSGTAEAGVEEEGDDGLGVDDAAIADGSHDLGEGHGDHLNELVLIEVGLSVGQVGGEEEVDALVGEARGGKDGGQAVEFAWQVAGFLLELAGGDVFPGFPLEVGAAGGDFEELAAGGVAELAQEYDVWIVGGRVAPYGHDGGGAGVSDQLDVTGGPIRESDGVNGEVDDPAVVEGSRGELPGLFAADQAGGSGIDEGWRLVWLLGCHGRF